MNSKKLAEKLSGVEYGNEYVFVMRETAKQAKEAGLVIAIGESDDLLEFYGAFRDEAGANDGVTVLLDSNGLIPSWQSVIDNGADEDEAEKYFARKRNARSIEAVWCGPEDAGYCWILKTDIPHETFAVMEGGEGFSRGIVFSLSDLKGF